MSTVKFGNSKRVLELPGEEPPSRRSRLSQSLLEAEIESLKSELEHERSLRELDHRRAQQAQQRLERQVQFATEETEELKHLMEEFRRESEARIQDLRESRAGTLADLRDCEQRLQEMSCIEDQKHDRKLAEEQKCLLQSQLQARSEEVEDLRERLQEVTKDALAKQVSRMSTIDVNEKDPFPTGHLSPAPKAVLKELNRTRLELAESERMYRQLCRKSDEWQQKAQQYVYYKEAARNATARVAKLEGELREAHKKLENLHSTNDTWGDFARELGKNLSLSLGKGGPPEIATVLRHFQRHIKQAKTAEAEKASLEDEAESYKNQITALEMQSRDTSTLLARAKRDNKELEAKIDTLHQRIRTLESQEGIWQREAGSLRDLVKIFDDMAPGVSTTNSASVKTLELALGTAHEEHKVIKNDRDILSKKLIDLEAEKKNVQNEYDQILDKFTKLRDALMEERAKASKAQDRAIHAELLAGQGAFNPNETRALHMDKNPLIDAIRERYQAEIYSLRRKLEQMTGEKIPDGILPTPEGVDPNKLHQRLKESFKEQINIFREGVYLITGYKIDMMHKSNGSSFRVRSVYAEREEDFLEFYWPKGVKDPKSLELGATDFAKMLSTTHSYQYLKKYDSCPAFVASTQLSLFEKCTIVQFG